MNALLTRTRQTTNAALNVLIKRHGYVILRNALAEQAARHYVGANNVKRRCTFSNRCETTFLHCVQSDQFDFAAAIINEISERVKKIATKVYVLPNNEKS